MCGLFDIAMAVIFVPLSDLMLREGESVAGEPPLDSHSYMELVTGRENNETNQAAILTERLAIAPNMLAFPRHGHVHSE
jgi:hypothetical protein